MDANQQFSILSSALSLLTMVVEFLMVVYRRAAGRSGSNQDSGDQAQS